MLFIATIIEHLHAIYSSILNYFLACILIILWLYTDYIEHLYGLFHWYNFIQNREPLISLDFHFRWTWRYRGTGPWDQRSRGLATNHLQGGETAAMPGLDGGHMYVTWYDDDFLCKRSLVGGSHVVSPYRNLRTSGATAMVVELEWL